MRLLFGSAGLTAVLVTTVADGRTPMQVQAVAQEPRAAPSVAPSLPHTQQLLARYVRDGKAAGIVAAIGVGTAPAAFPAAGRIGDNTNAPAAGPDSLWRVYSMTKPITGMAAMILIEDGRLRLDQPIGELLPGFRQMRVLAHPDTSLASTPARAQITVRHLLTHTAGLGYPIVTRGPLLKEYERQGILPAAISAPVEAQMRPRRPTSLQAFAERVATLPLIAEPGTRWSYSIGFDLLGAVIERASGMRFEQFVQARIFDPLQMRSTFWQVPRAERYRLADNQAWIGDTRVPLDPGATSVFLDRPSFPYGGAGLVMSARDHDRFLAMLVNGGMLDGVRVMQPGTVQLATSNLLPPGVTFEGIDGSTGGTSAGVPMGFGAGGAVYLADQPGGPSKGAFGWGGAAGTFGWIDPARKMRGTVMVNYMPADRWPLRFDLAAALHRDLAQAGRVQ